MSIHNEEKLSLGNLCIDCGCYSPVENIIGVTPLVPDHSTQASEGRVAQLGECWQLLEAVVDDVQILQMNQR